MNEFNNQFTGTSFNDSFTTKDILELIGNHGTRDGHMAVYLPGEYNEELVCAFIEQQISTQKPENLDDILKILDKLEIRIDAPYYDAAKGAAGNLMDTDDFINKVEATAGKYNEKYAEYRYKSLPEGFGDIKHGYEE